MMLDICNNCIAFNCKFGNLIKWGKYAKMDRQISNWKTEIDINFNVITLIIHWIILSAVL